MKTKLNRFIFVAAILLAALTGINARVSSRMFIAEQEAELEIESWMTDDSHWSRSGLDVAQAIDRELTIEKWMTDDAFWN